MAIPDHSGGTRTSLCVRPGGLANSPTWGDITQNPIGDLTRFSPSIPAASGGTPGAVSFQGLTWTPDSVEANHSCIIVTAAANGISFNPDPSTLWSDLQTNAQTGWLNVTVLTVSASDPTNPVPPIIFIGAAVGASVHSPSVTDRTIRIPLHADPALTRNANLVTQRVPLSEHSSDANAAVLDSASTFGLAVNESGGEQGRIGNYVTDLVYLEITVPTDVKAGTQAVFDVATEHGGATFNGYRVVFKFG